MKKNLLIMLLVLILCFSFTACGSSSNNINDNNTPEDNPGVQNGNTGELISEYENLNIYNDSYGDPHALYVAELKNSSNKPLTITNASIDVEDTVGNVLITTDFISFYPFVIAPGESAYICEEVANIYSDEGLEFSLIDNAVLNYSTEEHSDSEPVDIEFSNLNLENNNGQVIITGSIKNISNESLSETCICLPIKDNAGRLQYFMFTPIENLEAGETREFEQTSDSLDPNMDLSNSTIDAFAYRSIAEQN